MGMKAIKIKSMQAKLSPMFHQNLLSTYCVPDPLCKVRDLVVSETNKRYTS